MILIRSFTVFFSFLCPLFIYSQSEKVDLSVMQKIRNEEMAKSKVMDIAFHLTDASGPRLTGSPGFMRAANYARNQLAGWGLSNAILDPWGEFGKSWELEKSYVAMSSPYYKPLEAFPKSWTAGSGGAKTADVLLITAKDSAALDMYRGKLGGKLLVIDREDVYKPSYKPDAYRYTDVQLDSMQNIKNVPEDTAAMRRRRAQFQGSAGLFRMMAALRTIASKEGAIGLLSGSVRGHDGTIFVQGGGPYKSSDPANILDIALANEDYMTIVRLLRAGIQVHLDIDVQSRFITNDLQGYNVIAEIKGSDKKLKDEVVMLGGHLDSWHGGTGATDNAAGCAIMMEAVRIIKTLNLNPSRTIRIALWSGEEEGLFGSRGYVKKTFADPTVMELLPAHEKLSAYFNVDNGSGKIRGIYAQQNEEVAGIFTQWLAPFNDLGAKTVTISNTGSTDHVAFDAVGLPGFQFIQDPLEYETRTHHSNMDTYDHLSEDDLKQAATIVAGFVYNAAMRDQKLPRKELPKPRPATQRGF